jgi:hypothetical protein
LPLLRGDCDPRRHLAAEDAVLGLEVLDVAGQLAVGGGGQERRIDWTKRFTGVESVSPFPAGEDILFDHRRGRGERPGAGRGAGAVPGRFRSAPVRGDSRQPWRDGAGAWAGLDSPGTTRARASG